MVKASPFSFHELVWSGHSSPLAFDFDRGDRDLILNLSSWSVATTPRRGVVAQSKDPLPRVLSNGLSWCSHRALAGFWF
jgi:hypothetical protein